MLKASFCAVGLMAVGVHSLSLKQGLMVPTDMNPLDLNPDNIEPGEPDYTGRGPYPTFTNDGQPHVMKSEQGCPGMACDDQSGSDFNHSQEPYVEDFGHDEYGNQMRFKQDPTFSGYGDREFTNQGDSKQEHSVQESEPNECNHCAKENAEKKAAAEAAAAAGSFIQLTDPPYILDPPVREANADREIVTGSRAYGYEEGPGQSTAVEPNECDHCAKENAAKAEAAAAAAAAGGFIEIRQDPNLSGYGDREFTNQGDSKQEHSVQESEPNECNHCAKENAEKKAAAEAAAAGGF